MVEPLEGQLIHPTLPYLTPGKISRTPQHAIPYAFPDTKYRLVPSRRHHRTVYNVIQYLLGYFLCRPITRTTRKVSSTTRIPYSSTRAANPFMLRQRHCPCRGRSIMDYLLYYRSNNIQVLASLQHQGDRRRAAIPPLRSVTAGSEQRTSRHLQRTKTKCCQL